ncbi:MAG: hypothetical protein OXH00_14745 [Candidatus Poribacteria bacterium]|nr:hypothetical protein [Candidatus Poribacteria bacterium]
MTEEAKDHVELEARQSLLKDKHHALKAKLERLQDFRKEVVETKDRTLAEVDEKIQFINEEIHVCENELSKIADL